MKVKFSPFISLHICGMNVEKAIKLIRKFTLHIVYSDQSFELQLKYNYSNWLLIIISFIDLAELPGAITVQIDLYK